MAPILDVGHCMIEGYIVTSLDFSTLVATFMEALPAGQYTQIWSDLTVNHADKHRSLKGFAMYFAILFSPSTLGML